MIRLAAFALIIVSWLSIALGQDQPPVTALPVVAVRGQLIWVRTSTEPALIRVMRAADGEDHEASQGDDGSPRLVRVASADGQPTYIYATPDAGQYYVEIVLVDQGKATIHRASFTVTDTIPPPPPPQPDVGTAPFPSPGGVRVLIWSDVETRSVLPAATMAVLTGKDAREYLGSVCVQEKDGTPGYRIWDTDYTDAQIARSSSDKDVSAIWRAAYEAARKHGSERNTKHLMLAASPRGGYVGDIPSSIDELRKIIDALK
jgi:hypothetical protein